MHKLTKRFLTGVVALGLLAPVATQAFNNNSQTTVNAKRRHRSHKRVRRAKRSYALSYYYAKEDVSKAYNGKDKLHDHFSLRNNGQHGNRTYLKASFGANAVIYFTVTHSGRYAHIHTTIRASAGDAAIPGFPKVSTSYYHMYGVQRNKIVRAY